MLRLEYFWVILSILCQSTAIAFSKMAGLVSLPSSPISWIINPWYPLALIAMSLQAFFWTQALKNCSLSVAYPLSSLVFAVNLVFALFFFGEKITYCNILGIIFIVLGVGFTLKEAR